MSTDPVQETQRLDAAPGWKWDPATETYVWWDGSNYVRRARWTGASWAVSPLYSAPPPPATRSTRWWLWGSLLGVVGVIGVIAVGLFVYAFHEACCTHDLLETDFESVDGPFETGVTDAFTADLYAGTYRITSTASAPDSPASSYAWLARAAGAMHAEVTIVDPGSGSVGVACLLAGTDDPAFGQGYGFVVAGGTASLVDIDGGRTLRRASVEPLEPRQRIAVRCGFGGLEGHIDGTVVLSTRYDRGRGHQFGRVALLFEPAEVGDAARFDDVDVHLPG